VIFEFGIYHHDRCTDGFRWGRLGDVELEVEFFLQLPRIFLMPLMVSLEILGFVTLGTGETTLKISSLDKSKGGLLGKTNQDVLGDCGNE